MPVEGNMDESEKGKSSFRMAIETEKSKLKEEKVEIQRIQLFQLQVPPFGKICLASRFATALKLRLNVELNHLSVFSRARRSTGRVMVMLSSRASRGRRRGDTR